MAQQGERIQDEYLEGEAVAVVYSGVYSGESPQEAASALEAAIIILSVVAVLFWLVLR